jgi:hypothetical protein
VALADQRHFSYTFNPLLGRTLSPFAQLIQGQPDP